MSQTVLTLSSSASVELSLPRDDDADDSLPRDDDADDAGTWEFVMCVV